MAYNDTPYYQKGTSVTEKQQEPVVVVVQNDLPTTKQQLTSAAIQIGAGLAVPVLLAGALGAASVVSSVKSRIAKRRTPSEPTDTEATTAVED